MKARVLAAVTTIAAAIFAALYFTQLRQSQRIQVVERNVPVDRVVERRVEVPVERVVEKRVEVPVERVVEKKVEVPRPIPPEYIEAYRLYGEISKATWENVLKDISSVQLHVSFSGETESLLSRNAIRTKLELGLRRSGIKVIEKAPAVLSLEIHSVSQAIAGNPINSYVFLNIFVGQPGCVFNGRGVRAASAVLWEKRFYAYGPTSDVKQTIMSKIDEYMDAFCLAWLTDNSIPNAPSN